jgi:hypothetical protein
MNAVTTGLWKGCLGGIGLAAVFFFISGLTYLILSQTGLSPNIALFFTIASGPIVGTFGLAAIVWFRAHAQVQTTAKIDSDHPSTLDDE